MFLFNQKQVVDKSISHNIFTETDIKQILSTFSLDESRTVSTKNGHPKVFHSTSGTSLVQADEIRKSLESWCNREHGRKSISEFASTSQVDSNAILELLTENNDWSMTTTDQRFVISKHEQKMIAERLVSLAIEIFVDELSFCSKENIESGYLTTILKRNNKQDELVTFRRPSETRPNQNKTFLVSHKLQDKVSNDIVSQVLKAEGAAADKPQMNGAGVLIESSTFSGLTTEDAIYLCELVKVKEVPIKGVFSIEGEDIFYMPRSYTSAVRTRLFLDLQTGRVPLLAASDLVKQLPGEFESESAAMEAIRDFNEASPTIYVLDNCAISNVWIKAKGGELKKDLDNNKPASLTTYCADIPVLYKEDTWRLIIDTLGSHNAYNAVGDHIFNKQWIQGIEERAKALARDLAEQSWKNEDSPKPKAAALTSKVREDVRSELQTKEYDNKLIDTLLITEQKTFDSSVLEEYNTYTNQLELTCDEQFKNFWASRVVENSRLYARALESLEEGTLKTQLEALLLLHLVSELVTSTISKAKTRKLLRSPRLKLSTRVSKLQTTLAEKKELASALQELEKFNSKIGITESEGDALQEKKAKHLSSMADTMSKDEDPVRLFISLLIVLYSLPSQGVLYATGKFAPRILKFIKPSLDTERANWLEQVKDAVKSGSVTDEMKVAMRDIAAKAVKDLS